MNGTPLVIDEEVRSQIKACIELAAANPIDMPALMERLSDPAKKEHHMAQMTRQTVKVPLAYMVTFSIEDGHPIGRCRHMSMSVQRKDRVPNPIGLWMIAQEFGFWGDDLLQCDGVWEEQLQGHGVAINVVQIFDKPDGLVVRSVAQCGVCGAPVDRFATRFQCRQHPAHFGDLNTGVISDHAHPSE